MYKHNILQWEQISIFYNRGVLLLGNGASMSVDTRFGYKSLVEHAVEKKLFNEDLERLFKFFETTDFELILRLVWQASNVNKSLCIDDDDKTRQAYIRVRNCLIKTVRSIHPTYNEVSHNLPTIYSFIKQFSTIISLNYDLILYWSTMYGSNINDRHTFKDCFIDGEFSDNWRKFKKPIYNEQSTSVVFYPHGNLILTRDKIESEFKLSNGHDNLLKSILDSWQTELYIPLFVSEGLSLQKIKSIQTSRYLNTVYREVLTNLGPMMVIYGWDLGIQDSHILKKISSSWVRRVAVSVYDLGDDKNQAFCHRVARQFHELMGEQVTVEFFYSNSGGCWNHTDFLNEL